MEEYKWAEQIRLKCINIVLPKLDYKMKPDYHENKIKGFIKIVLFIHYQAQYSNALGPRDC